MLRRLAGPMARRPLAVLLAALLVSGACAAGFVRFGIDAGQSLLVGSASAAGQANQRFTASFGTDPIVVVLSAGDTTKPGNPTAPYLEKNLQRLTALEEDLAHDPRVAEVLGPGTVAHSALSATTEEVSKTLTEYPYFIAETDFLVARQKGESDATKLQTQFQNDLTTAQQLLELYVARAAGDAHQARQAYQQKTIPSGDRIIDGQERAVEAAVAADPLPPLFTQYLAGPGNTGDETVARDFFDRLTAAFGDCDGSIAQLLQITSSCQTYLERILLDLPHCPTQSDVQANLARNTEVFCSPKTAWAAVLPPPTLVSGIVNGHAQQALLAREVITVRLTAAAAANRSSVLDLRRKISDELAHGIADDAYTRTFTTAQLSQLKDLGPLDPTGCGGAGQTASPGCYATYGDQPFETVIAGAPLLTYGIVDSMSETLLILLPVVLLLMGILLVTVFRVRGRLWPLAAALVAGGAAVGLSLWWGIGVTPAVLAGIPVLVGLGVDYAVQLVARYDEARARGGDREAAIAEALGGTGPATLTAALATLAGLVTLMLVAGVDAGPLVAVPLVAEFALVLVVGVVLSWLAALFVALPAAALRDAAVSSGAAAPSQARPAERTLAIAAAWRGAVVPAVLVAAVGWILLPRVPVQTEVDQLLAPSLPQLQDINTVRDQTGYGNEIDISLQGQVAGPYNQPGTPANVTWQCEITQGIRSVHADQVALATSIADFFIAASSSTSATGAAPCVSAPPAAGTPSPSPSPGASTSPGATPTASASPAASATPTTDRTDVPQVRLAADTVPAGTSSPGPASPTPAAPTGSVSAAPLPSASPSPGQTPQSETQTAFLCDLRLLPELARNLVQPIPILPVASATQPCPAIDKYLDTWLNTDTTPIYPGAARIVIGTQSTSVADEARLIDSVRSEVAAPPNGMTAAPAGIAALAAQAYDNIVGRALLLNLLPLAVVFLALLAIGRDLRRAALPVLPTAIAAGWAPLILLLLGLLPGGVGKTLGSFNPLTVVLGALVIALATEFGVVLLRRFDEECARGAHPDDAAAIALASTGRAIRVSALTLGAGFAVLAVSALFPHGLPLLGAFGFTVLIDLGLAVLAVFGIMLPVAVAIARARADEGPSPAEALPALPPMAVSTAMRTSATAAQAAPSRSRAPAGKGRRAGTGGDVASAADAKPAPTVDDPAAPAEAGAPPRRSVSGRRKPPASTDPGAAPQATPRRPGVSGRRRRPGGPPSSGVP